MAMQALPSRNLLPSASDTPAWIVSLVVHLVVLTVLGLYTIPLEVKQVLYLLSNEIPQEELSQAPEEYYFSDDQDQERLGAAGMGGVEAALAEAPLEAERSEVPPLDFEAEVGNLVVDTPAEIATAPSPSTNLPVRGVHGEGTTGALGAIDRLTHEILLSLEQRKTLVVWIFDQSGSLKRQRLAISDRFDRVYRELGAIEATGNPAFAKHENKPLLTAVLQYGKSFSFLTPKPTDQVEEIKGLVRRIENDESGIENVFTAVYQAANKYRSYRTKKHRRNVMLIVVTDEAGDDQAGLDPTVELCRKFQMPVYVVGVPAPFGRTEVEIKYVDSDPKYDQRTQWIPVHQGPETLLPERVKLYFPSMSVRDEPIDSGFGPYALTRLCYETGGIYFTVHPNRNAGRAVTRDEIAELSAHLTHFFDPAIMRKYRPDYVSSEKYLRLVRANKAREALVTAAELSWAAPLENPRLTFPRRSEADLANILTAAQRDAAVLEPRIQRIYETLQTGEQARDKLTEPRWQAGYDLAMGRTLATMVRIKAYNAMLAQAKQGMRFQNANNDTWELRPANTIKVGSILEKQAAAARMYLQRVVKEHPGTPWAMLASRELQEPIGWDWRESYTGVNQPSQQIAVGNNNGPRLPQNEQRNNIQKPKPLRRPNL